VHGTVPRDSTLLARAIGVIMGVGGYLWLREFCSFKGMYRTYDVLTAAVIGSLAGAALSMRIGLARHQPVRYAWASLSPLLLLPVGALYWADRGGDLGISVRLAVISLLATYEAGAPGIALGQRLGFLLLPVAGMIAHAHLLMENEVTVATLESIGAGIALGLLCLAPVYVRSLARKRA